MFAKRILAILLISFSLAGKSITIRYATVELDDLAAEIVACPSFQRLQDVAQYGLQQTPEKQYSRFEHSIGVYYLLQLYGAPYHEQIAGLLHDASHTVFSHVGDILFRSMSIDYVLGDSYQDYNHLNWLAGTEIPEILARYGITVHDVDHKNPEFTMLDQSVPELCADRIEYNFVAGLLEGHSTVEDIQQFLEHLHFDHALQRWYFDDVELARKLAEISVYNTRYVWTNPLGVARDEIFVQALKRALELKVLTLHDIHYSTDSAVRAKLHSCNDAHLNSLLQDCFALESAEPQGPVKCRAVDPWVLMHGDYRRLSELDYSYEQTYRDLKIWCSQKSVI